MQKGSAIIIAGGLLTVSLGAAPMTWPTIDPYFAIPLQIVLWLGIGACLIVAFSKDDRAAETPANIIPDLRARDSVAIKALLANDDERRILVEKMRNGALTTWAHCKELKDAQRLKSSAWENATLEYEIVAGEPVTNVLPHNERRIRPWSNQPAAPTLAYWHDVYFNRAQLREHWPDKF